MTKEQKIQFIRNKCIEANPSIKSIYHESTGNNLRCSLCGEPDNYDTHGTCKKGKERKIRLADVLYLIQGKHVGIQSNGCFVNLYPGEPVGKYELAQFYRSWEQAYETFRWDLKNDNLDLQSEATVDFIFNLLK